MAFFTKVSKNQEEKLEDGQDVSEQSAIPVVATDSEATNESDWLDKDDSEGQLSVDVFQTKDNIVIKSTIAGVKPEDIDVSIDNDMVTIRGSRRLEEDVAEDDYFYQECYWGEFSRSVILPVEVKAEEAEASLKNGVLTLILPKAQKNKSVAVKVKGA
ncbi:MAG: Hsp20/alpha crystallin family protein [Patescibacteria group bacterium]